MSLQDTMNGLGQSARAAAHTLSLAPATQKKRALDAAAKAIRARVVDIVAANEIDMKAGEEKGLSKAMLDRLLLTPERIEAMAAGVDRRRAVLGQGLEEAAEQAVARINGGEWRAPRRSGRAPCRRSQPRPLAKQAGVGNIVQPRASPMIH